MVFCGFASDRILGVTIVMFSLFLIERRKVYFRGKFYFGKNFFREREVTNIWEKLYSRPIHFWQGGFDENGG